jgi:hypothetical protein
LPGIISTQWTVEPTARGNDVAALTVGVAQQRDMGAAVGVVFDALHLGRDAVLVTPEIHHPVVLLVAPALVADGDMAVVVPAGLPALLLHQGRMRLALVQARRHNLHDRAAAG